MTAQHQVSSTKNHSTTHQQHQCLTFRQICSSQIRL